MRKLMKSCPVPVYGLVEGVRPGHLHIIVTGAVEGRRPTDAKIGAGCCDQSVRLRQDPPFRHRGQRLREIWRKSVAARKSVGEGKRVAVRVEPGGGRIIK